jgi:polysaccharide export outer membrane protein
VLALVLPGCPKTTGPVTLPPPTKKQTDAVRIGDKLAVEVKGQEDLSGEFSIAEDGRFRFPRIGFIDAAGRKPSEIAREVEERLADGWLREPQVTVEIAARQNPEEVTVLGAVAEQGKYAHNGDLTLTGALSLAGGMTTEANRRKVQLTRQTEAGRRTVEVDVQAIFDGRAKDLVVAPGDIIVVPESPI